MGSDVWADALLPNPKRAVWRRSLGTMAHRIDYTGSHWLTCNALRRSVSAKNSAFTNFGPIWTVREIKLEFGLTE